ncbi:unnamed protein product [Spirodela intermedia]|uniref:SAM domain-containing protein n=1 Tax=Spirodela intermedia TaxID=51605 RepID=A0A7I8LBS6_SPIIN|nr:unnamed protein product [Spirodela intermedia]
MVPVYGGGRGEGKAVQWSAWLSRTGLDPAAAHQYAVLFAENELEEEDIAHFDHEFLLSMGISIAKHRLEILKLAHRELRRRHPPPSRPVARLLAAAGSARRRLVRCLRSLASGGGGGGAGPPSSALVAPHRSPFPGGIWASAVVKWGGRKPLRRGKPMLTDGSRRRNGGGSGNGGGDERRWDCMFQDLRPT